MTLRTFGAWYIGGLMLLASIVGLTIRNSRPTHTATTPTYSCTACTARTSVGIAYDYVKTADTWVCVEPNGLVVLSTSIPKGVYSVCLHMMAEPDGRDLNITTALRSVGARFEERE
jgi:hypothetical protein